MEWFVRPYAPADVGWLSKLLPSLPDIFPTAHRPSTDPDPPQIQHRSSTSTTDTGGRDSVVIRLSRSLSSRVSRVSGVSHGSRSSHSSSDSTVSAAAAALAAAAAAANANASDRTPRLSATQLQVSERGRRKRVVEFCAHLLELMSPVVILADDAHWLDDASWEVGPA
jgi:predicted ATPase